MDINFNMSFDLSSGDSVTDVSSDDSRENLWQKQCKRRADIVDLGTRRRMLQHRLKSLEKRRKVLQKKDCILKRRQQLLQQHLMEVLEPSSMRVQFTKEQTLSSSKIELTCGVMKCSDDLLPPVDTKTCTELTGDKEIFRRFNPRRSSVYTRTEGNLKAGVRNISTQTSPNRLCVLSTTKRTQVTRTRRAAVTKGLKRFFKKSIQCSWC